MLHNIPFPPVKEDEYQRFLKIREERNGILRLQQVHVPFWRRLALELRRRIVSLKDRILHPSTLMQIDRRPRWIDGRNP